MKIAYTYNISVVITNQVMSNPDGSAMFTGNVKVPVGGDIMAHSSTTRLQLKKGKGENRICKLFCSPHIGE